jgi:NTE family protein
VVVVPVGDQQFVTLPPEGSTNIGAFTFAGVLDRLDSINFPRYGYYARGDIYTSTELLGADEPYTRWAALASVPFTWGPHTVDATISGGGKIGADAIPPYDQFPLGGFLRLSGLSPQQLRTDSFVFGRLTYRGRVANLPLFEGIYVGASLEASRLKPLVPIWRGSVVPGYLTVTAGSVFLGIDSPLGALYLAFGYSNSDNKAVYLFLGRP